MSIFNIFVSEQEKQYRRGELHEKFCSAVYNFLSEEKAFEDFAAEKSCFIYHSDSPRSFGIGPSGILSRYKNVIDLSKINGYKKVINTYNDLKKKNTPWKELFEKLNDPIFDLLIEAVYEFEKKYTLPKRW